MGRLMSSTGIVGIALASMVMASAPGHAALIETALPENAYITVGAYDWAWAFPLPSTDSRFDLSFQSAFGWRIPTLAELALAPLATDFLFAGGNVPFNGTDPVSGASFSFTNAAYTGDGACATPYFSSFTGFQHCDWGQGLGQPHGPWAGMAGAQSSAEQLVIRDASPAQVPGTLPPFATAFILIGLVGWIAQRQRRVA